MNEPKIPILLDKSALEGLALTEIEYLARHYLVIVPPILFQEIQSDLYKREDRSVSYDDPIDPTVLKKVSNKVCLNDAVMNVHYRNTCIDNLLGLYHFSKFLPFVQATHSEMTSDGQVIATIDHATDMQPIRNWQQGEYDENTKTAAKEWRELSAQIDLKSSKIQFTEILGNLKARTLKEVFDKLNQRFGNVANVNFHWKLISDYCNVLEVPPRGKSLIAMRWQSQPSKFQDFAPYAYYCFLVRSTFSFGLANTNDLILTSKREKAWIDLHYAYYFPFGRVFSSGDNQQRKFWEAFGNHDQQRFVGAQDLRLDLIRLRTHWESLSEEQRKELHKSRHSPPKLEGSFTFNTFEEMIKMGALPSREQFEAQQNFKTSPEEQKTTVDRIMDKYNSLKKYAS